MIVTAFCIIGAKCCWLLPEVDEIVKELFIETLVNHQFELMAAELFFHK